MPSASVCMLSFHTCTVQRALLSLAQDGLAEVSGLLNALESELIEGSVAVHAASAHSKVAPVFVPEEPAKSARICGPAPAASHSASSQSPAAASSAGSREGFQRPAEQAASSSSAPLSTSPHQTTATGEQRLEARSTQPLCEANDALAGRAVDAIIKAQGGQQQWMVVLQGLQQLLGDLHGSSLAAGSAFTGTNTCTHLTYALLQSLQSGLFTESLSAIAMQEQWPNEHQVLRCRSAGGRRQLCSGCLSAGQCPS